MKWYLRFGIGLAIYLLVGIGALFVLGAHLEEFSFGLVAIWPGFLLSMALMAADGTSPELGLAFLVCLVTLLFFTCSVTMFLTFSRSFRAQMAVGANFILVTLSLLWIHLARELN